MKQTEVIFSEAKKREIIRLATKENGDFCYQRFLDEIEKVRKEQTKT